MAYEGYLLKIHGVDDNSDWIFPTDKIKAETYSAYVNMQDLEPWTDANGYLHRNAVELKALKVEFETKAMLTNIELSELLNQIRRRYTNRNERRVVVTAYIPELDDYQSQDAYVPDFTPQIYFADRTKIQYNPIRMAFIGGLASD